MTVLARNVETRGIRVLYGAKAERLVTDPQGRVLGIIVDRAGKSRRIRALGGVVLAAGGFSWNEAMKRHFLKAYPILGQVPGLTGDGILLGMSVGAALGGMNEVCGVPLFRVPGTDRGAGVPIRTAPSCIMVNRRGRRFCNESADYDSVNTSFYAYNVVDDTYENIPAWMVFDEAVRSTGPVVGEPGWSKDNSVEIQRGYIYKADSIEELANLIGVNPQELARTVAEYNAAAARGKDPLFHRGEIPGTAGPAPLVGPPYYAIEVYPGMYDTTGGLKINEKGQVLNVFGTPIEGLYAAGANAHMALGFYYPNGGTCIGQSLVFGRIAGRSAAAAA